MLAMLDVSSAFDNLSLYPINQSNVLFFSKKQEKNKNNNDIKHKYFNQIYITRCT